MMHSRSSPSQRKTSAQSPAGLPAERAFVIQLRADADLERGIVRGRVEHVLSGAVAQFDSLEQLLDCIRDVVARRATRSSGRNDASTP